LILNHDLIRDRCQEIAESLERLERIREKPKEEFLRDQDLRDIACYRLLIAIEAALGLCYHVSARRLQKVPEDYAGCFALLGDAGIITTDLSKNLQKMARFRNLLVHMYWKVDYEKLYDLIQQDLEDLRLFARTIVQLL
jgi:uncharacterized protein YutE (UPF0331/DUF86 family)